MTKIVTRFAARLLVPALAIGALAALGEPIDAVSHEARQEQATRPLRVVHVTSATAAQEIAIALQAEADLLRREADAAKKAARQTAAQQMRWFLTLPSASSKGSAPEGAS